MKAPALLAPIFGDEKDVPKHPPRVGMSKAETRRRIKASNRLNQARRDRERAALAQVNASALPTPQPSNADAVQADPDVVSADLEATGRNVFAAVVKGSTAPVASPKTRMGRPPTNGVRPSMVLLRTLSILKHFEEARRTLGHKASIAATVKAVRAEFDASVVIDPKPVTWERAGHKWDSPPAEIQRVNASIPRVKGVNKAEVERVLAEFQPEVESTVFRVRSDGSGGALWLGGRSATRNKRIKLR